MFGTNASPGRCRCAHRYPFRRNQNKTSQLLPAKDKAVLLQALTIRTSIILRHRDALRMSMHLLQPRAREYVTLSISEHGRLTKIIRLRSRELQRLRQSALLRHQKPTEKIVKNQVIKHRLHLFPSHCLCRTLCQGKLSRKVTHRIWQYHRVYSGPEMRRLPSTVTTLSTTKTSTALVGSWFSISIKNSTPQ